MDVAQQNAADRSPPSLSVCSSEDARLVKVAFRVSAAANS